MSPFEIQAHLRSLEAERVLATLEGLASDPAYMADLADEIETARAAYTVAAVIEIAKLRAELSEPARG